MCNSVEMRVPLNTMSLVRRLTMQVRLSRRARIVITTHRAQMATQCNDVPDVCIVQPIAWSYSSVF